MNENRLPLVSPGILKVEATCMEGAKSDENFAIAR